MKKRFWLCKRGAVFYLLDTESGQRTSLRTRNYAEAARLAQARDEAAAKPAFGFALARAYLSAFDPRLSERTWQDVLDEFCSRGQPQTQAFRRRKAAHRAFNAIRNKSLIATSPEDFRAVLKTGQVMIQAVLRSLQNLALGLGWLPWPILAPKLWPELRYRPKRGITQAEHSRIIAAEQNRERRLYYELLWETGASQTDAALLQAENVDWANRTLSYQRKKTGTCACLTIGPRLQALLRELPPSGPLFPSVMATPEKARSAEFWRRCRLLGIRGVSLHSYRYSWAERARELGYPERFAMEALGHNSPAIHRAYSRNAQVQIPPLESFEKVEHREPRVITPFPMNPVNAGRPRVDRSALPPAS